MNREEAERRTQCITTMLAIWNCSSNEDMIAVYVASLKDVPVELLEKTCKKLMIESESRPVPATILKAANNLISEFTGDEILPWDEAWKEIEKEMHDTFVYGKPKFSRIEIEKAVNAFGWNELCEVTTKDLPIVRAQLRDMYLAICEQSRKSKVNKYVTGNGTLIGGNEQWKLLQ